MNAQPNSALEGAMKAMEDGLLADDWIERVSVSRQLMPLLDQLQLLSLKEYVATKKTDKSQTEHDIAMHIEMRRMLLRDMEAVAPIAMNAIKRYYENEER